MELKYIQFIIDMMKIIAPFLGFLLVVAVAMSYQPGSMKITILDKSGNRLKERQSGFLDYENIRLFMLANGETLFFFKIKSPVTFILIRLVTASICFMGGMQLHWAAAVLLALTGFWLPVLLMRSKNKKDNEKMLMQIKTLYSNLNSQIGAGVYITDALAEVYDKYPQGRLRTALEDMNNELFFNKNFEDAIDHFNEKFNNMFIDSLCVILKQAQETGRAVELLNDMSEDIRNMRVIQLAQQRSGLDLYTLFCLIGIAMGPLMTIVWALYRQILDTAGAL